MTKFLNISTDNTLGGASPSDEVVSSQKAIKDYIDNNPVAYDNKSITMNGSSQLQASGVIDQSDTTKAVKVWTGTLDEYNSLTPDNNTIYNITDDETTISTANTDLSNLTSIGKNISNWSSNVSNCITYIPQDIKLELSNGTLTLKAGSKVCVPNGFEQDGTTPHFDFITINQDISPTVDMGSGANFICIKYDTQELEGRLVANSRSGAGATATGGLAYDTTTNKVGFYNSSSSLSHYTSFPIAIVSLTSTGTTISNINQIFNGAGYIGSSIFVLPGLKCLIPKGINEDGTLKSTEIVSESVVVRNGIYGTTLQTVVFTGSGIGVNYYEYSKNRNDVYLTTDGTPYNDRCIIGTVAYNTTRIISFRLKEVFHSIDYGDCSIVDGWSMPSGTIQTLTLGASGASYTAPTNGYFRIYGTVTAGNGYVNASCNGYNDGDQNATNTGSCWVNVPAKKSSTLTVSYANFSINSFYFIYAQGEVI